MEIREKGDIRWGVLSPEPATREEVMGLAPVKSHHILLGLEKLDMIMASSLQALLILSGVLNAAGFKLVLFSPTDSAMRVFKITGLDRLFTFANTLEEAFRIVESDKQRKSSKSEK